MEISNPNSRKGGWRARIGWLVKRLGLSLAASVLGLLGWFILPPPQRDPTLPDYGDAVAYDPRREGGHLRPGLDWLMQGEGLDQRIRFVTDSRGFRNAREFPVSPPAGVCRIYFMGDSFVDGMRTDQELTLGAQLERALSAARLAGENREYEVMISGHDNPANAWYGYQEHGAAFSPHVVILGVTLGNDLTWHNHGGGMTPVRDADGLPRLEWTGSFDPALCGRHDVAIPSDSLVRRSWIGRRMAGWERAARGRLAAKSGWFADLPAALIVPERVDSGALNAGDHCLSLGIFHQPPIPEAAAMYEATRSVLAGLNAQVRHHGARLLVVLFPTRIQVSETEWRLLARLRGLEVRRFDLERPNRLLGDFMKEAGIVHVDLLEGFREQARRGVRLYRARGDMHLNEAGNREAAARIQRAVRELLQSRE